MTRGREGPLDRRVGARPGISRPDVVYEDFGFAVSPGTGWLLMRRSSRVLLAAVPAAALAFACAGDPTGPGVGEEFALEPGERVLLPTEVYVRFLRVPQDSRCPIRAQCVWLGDAEVVLELAAVDGDAAQYILHTNEEAGARAVALGPRELTLLRLDPWPEIPAGVAREEYRAVLVLHERLQTTSDPD